MKILHTESSCGWGGQELRILNEARGLARRGHQLLIAAPPESRIYAEAHNFGLAVRALPIARKRFAGWRALRALLKDEAPQVVNTHSSTDSWLVALACLSLKNAPPAVRTRHISAPIASNVGTRWLYSRAAVYVATTGEALRRHVIEQSGASPAYVTSVPTGVDLERFRPGERAAARAQLGFSDDDFLIGIVATLRSWKGHRYLLDALARIPDARVKVVIVGTGPAENNLQRQVRELGLAQRVVMAGHHDDVVPWLHSFDVFALPSYANEGVPQALMQAMACGIPVITTDVGAIGEIVSDGKTGLMVKAQDVDALRVGLERLIHDEQLRRTLADNALTSARENFSEARMLDGMERIFSAAVAARL